MAKPQRRAVSPLRGEVRPQKRFCQLQTCSPHSKPSQPPLGAWRAGRVHPHLFSVWQLGDALSFPCYSLSFRRRRAARVWGHSRFSPAAFGPAGVSPLRGEVRPQKRFCPLQTCSPHSKPSQPPLGAWRAGRVHPFFFSVWQLGDALSFPCYSLFFRPPAGRVCGDTVDSPLQRSDPVLATCQSSTSHSINPDKDAKGSPSWRRVPLLTIRSGYTFQFGEYPPPPRRGFN